MKAANLEVLFDKEFYKPNDEVLVKILLTAKKEIYVNSLVARIYGITEQKTISTVDVYNYKSPDYKTETLFEKQEIFLKNEVIMNGEHKYYIKHRLPMMNLKKMKDAGYHAKFFVNAHVDIPWSIDLDVRQRILVLSSDKEFRDLKRKVNREIS